MPGEYRGSGRNRSVSFKLTMMAWVTIGPAVAIGLLTTALFAGFVLRVDFVSLIWIAAFGGVVMLVCAIPGQLAYRNALRQRVLAPLGEVVSQTQTSAESVMTAAGQLAGAASEINSSCLEIGSAMQKISNGLDLQSSEVEAMSTSTESMTASFNNVAARADETREMSRQAAAAALLGEEITNETIRKIAAVRNAIEALSSSIAVLGVRSKEIGTIVGVITSIADQTNLLSLNAAIEAARAGQLGQGFAVVAEQVNTLSERSAKAAEQIGALIGEIQDETAESVKRMEISAAEVVLGSELADKTGEALHQITEAVGRTAALADEIASAMADRAQDANKLDRSMHDIAAVAEESAGSVQQSAAATEEQAACTQEIAAAAQELADMARRLRESALQFELD